MECHPRFVLERSLLAHATRLQARSRPCLGVAIRHGCRCPVLRPAYRGNDGGWSHSAHIRTVSGLRGRGGAAHDAPRRPRRSDSCESGPDRAECLGTAPGAYSRARPGSVSAHAQFRRRASVPGVAKPRHGDGGRVPRRQPRGSQCRTDPVRGPDHQFGGDRPSLAGQVRPDSRRGGADDHPRSGRGRQGDRSAIHGCRHRYGHGGRPNHEGTPRGISGRRRSDGFVPGRQARDRAGADRGGKGPWPDPRRPWPPSPTGLFWRGGPANSARSRRHQGDGALSRR